MSALAARRRRTLPLYWIFGSFMVFLLDGCQALKTDQYLLVWLVVPFLGFLGIGGSFVYSRRSRQLDQWDLQRDPADPGVSGMLNKLIWAAVTIFVIFAIYNLYLQGMDWSLKMMNIGLWLLGSIVGVYLASFLSLRLAEGRLSSTRGTGAVLPPRRS